MRICEAGRQRCGCKEFTKGIRTIDGQYPDDNREFKIAAGAGIQISPITAGIEITNTTDPGALEAGQNIELTPNGNKLTIGTTDDIAVAGDLSVAGDSTLNGDLNVNGDIFQQGASYESHMEQVYTTNDYIIMRDGAVAALPSGDYAGFQVKKYDGTNDGRLVIDNTGTARVGDVGDEQPLLTRSESGSLTDGQLFKWDAANSKAVGQSLDTAPTSGSSAPVTSDGILTALNKKITKDDLFFKQGDTITTGSSYVYYGFVENSTQIILDIKLPKLLDRPFNLTINTIDVYGVNGSFSQASNPISGIATNNQTFDTIRVIVTFTNAHSLTVARPVSGFITYTLSVL